MIGQACRRWKFTNGLLCKVVKFNQKISHWNKIIVWIFSWNGTYSAAKFKASGAFWFGFELYFSDWASFQRGSMLSILHNFSNDFYTSYNFCSSGSGGKLPAGKDIVFESTSRTTLPSRCSGACNEFMTNFLILQIGLLYELFNCFSSIASYLTYRCLYNSNHKRNRSFQKFSQSCR